jgi:hypothetical protein
MANDLAKQDRHADWRKRRIDEGHGRHALRIGVDVADRQGQET